MLIKKNNYKNLSILYLGIGIFVILGGTLIDAIFIRSYTFIEYLVICTWEFVIYLLGIITGYIITKNK